MAGGLTACRDVGLAIARRLADEAFWHEDRCTWTGDDIDHGPGSLPEGELVHRPVGADLYGGTSGIAWFLAHAQRGCDDGELGRAALGAARHSLRHTALSPADTGLYTGALGVALAVATVARLLADDPAAAALWDASGHLAETVAESCLAGDPPVAGDPGGADVIQGDAGRVVGLLVLSRRPGASSSLAAAAAVAGERLLAAAERGPEGWSWPANDSDWPNLCGLGHGASGPAVALGMLAASTGDERFTEGAAQAQRYERSWFSRDHGNWPDLRSAPGDHPSFWCHGAGGIGVARLHEWRRTAEPTALAEAAGALDTATAATLRALSRGSTTGSTKAPFERNLSLCHGVGSVVELHALAAEVTGDDDHLAHGRRLALWAVGLAGDGGEAETEAAIREIACGVPGGGEAPGLMLGLAGVGAMFLRLADPAALPSPALPVDW